LKYSSISLTGISRKLMNFTLLAEIPNKTTTTLTTTLTTRTTRTTRTTTTTTTTATTAATTEQKLYS
jgi:hypothetical protein